jgi:2-octaprenyl-6-methoxyphenol hydroxylase
MLGAVMSYGAIVAPLQAVWTAAVAAAPQRLHSRFGEKVAALKNVAGGVEVDAGIAERFDLAVVAEGGVFAEQGRTVPVDHERPPLKHDYRQTAWVGRVTFAPGASAVDRGVAFERFTRHGPAALLPLGAGKAALIWCVDSADDPVRDLSDAQRVAVLNTLFHPSAGRIESITPLKAFALGLNAERTLSQAAPCASATPRRRCTRSPARASTSACAMPSSSCAACAAMPATSRPCCASSNGSAAPTAGH